MSTLIAPDEEMLADRGWADYGKMVWKIPLKHPGFVMGWNPNRPGHVMVRWGTDWPKSVWVAADEVATELIWNTASVK